MAGRMTVAVNNQTIQEMQSKCHSYAGYNDLVKEGLFVNPYTGEEIRNPNWAFDEPNNWGVGEDCTENKDGYLNDISCTQKYCTLCNLSKRPEFELRGFCVDEPIGPKYLMDVEDQHLDVYDIIGWSATILTWNKEMNRWEFQDLSSNNVVAYCNETITYPFGVHR